jgi:single-stranded-DNA-specific exonuclease
MMSDAGEFISGSCRSLSGVHIKDILDQDNTDNPGLIIKYGGHAKAAGLSIKKGYFDKFQEEVVKVIDSLNITPFTGMYYDIDIKSDFINEGLLSDLKSLFPYGESFREPIFRSKMTASYVKAIGGNKTHLSLNLDKIKAVWFSCVKNEVLPIKNKDVVDVLFTVSDNTYNGKTNVQLMVNYLYPKR